MCGVTTLGALQDLLQGAECTSETDAENIRQQAGRACGMLVPAVAPLTDDASRRLQRDLIQHLIPRMTIICEVCSPHEAILDVTLLRPHQCDASMACNAPSSSCMFRSEQETSPTSSQGRWSQCCKPGRCTSKCWAQRSWQTPHVLDLPC